MVNPGFSPAEIKKCRLAMGDKSYQLLDADEANDEYWHFYFVGKANGAEVIYDAVVYTLRLQHESELYDLAEQKAADHFPAYKKLREQELENPSAEPDELEEEIGLFIADAIMEMEEEGEVKVKEHVETDDEAEFGIGLDAGLNVPKITERVVEKLIRDFNNDTLELDETLITFETGDASQDLRFKE